MVSRNMSKALKGVPSPQRPRRSMHDAWNICKKEHRWQAWIIRVNSCTKRPNLETLSLSLSLSQTHARTHAHMHPPTPTPTPHTLHRIAGDQLMKQASYCCIFFASRLQVSLVSIAMPAIRQALSFPCYPLPPYHSPYSSHLLHQSHCSTPHEPLAEVYERKETHTEYNTKKKKESISKRKVKFGERLFTTYPHVSDYILWKTQMGNENRWQIEFLRRFGVYTFFREWEVSSDPLTLWRRCIRRNVGEILSVICSRYPFVSFIKYNPKEKSTSIMKKSGRRKNSLWTVVVSKRYHKKSK